MERKRPVTLELPQPHPRQYEFVRAFEDRPGLRFVVAACGTKFGKTYGSTIRLVQEAWEHKNSLNWWVAPSYAQSKMAYDLVKKLIPAGTFEEYKADLRITLLEPDGSEHSRIEFKSGDNPDTLRGYAVNFFVLDEAARMPYEAFVSVMTTVTQTRGRGIIISTPKGRGWFHEVYQRGEKANLLPGQTDDWQEWWSIRLPTWMNPLVPILSIDEMKKNLPEDVFRQEVAALFLAESAGVFRNIRGCIKGTLEPPMAGKSYVLGVDLARLRDYTVLTVMDRSRKHVVYHARFNELAWEVQAFRIREIAKMYNNATVCMDSTGVGDPLVETLMSMSLHVEPYKIGGSQSKQQLIERLRVSLEHNHISYPVVPTMILELENYEYKMTDTGVIRYSAPPGQHDDCVISLALANWVVTQEPWVYRYRNVPSI